MPANVEIKAHLRDPDAVRARAAALSDAPVRRIVQTDTFFPTAQGRLKLREEEGRGGELIYYERADAREAKLSRYEVHPIRGTLPGKLRKGLATVLGVRGVVRKRRELYQVGRTRIHIDAVEGLGDFLELEVQVDEDASPAVGRQIAARLMAELGVEEADLVAGAYLDLLTDA
ncbi:MAG: CYTH domain-containing protein [Candidatus Eisenbacteria bacterium]|nr:CYTH domain-containing protein [Candidatus Eisenbacteria bacterium]